LDLTNHKKITTSLTKFIENNKNEENNKKIKELTTKKINLENKMEKIIKTKQFTLYPSLHQCKILKNWIIECEKCYNKCVDLYNENPSIFNSYNYKKIKLIVFKMLYGDNTKNAPYDILTDEVRKFCSNLKSCESNLKNKNIKKFEMKHVNRRKVETTFFIPKTSIKNNNGFYCSYLGKMKGMENICNVIADCTITYNKNTQSYRINIPCIENRKKINQIREKVCAIDPGEATFVSYCGENTFGDIGIYMRNIITKKLNEISKMQKILRKGRNKKNEKLKNRSKIKNKIEKTYKYIKNIVKELHNKTALYLVKKYDRIMIPEFRTQNMLKKKYGKKYFEELKRREGEAKMREELRRVTRMRKMNKKTKAVLNQLSHYKFRQHLINKGNEYGCEIEVVTENETTMTCTFCGTKGEYEIKGRTRECHVCEKKCNRDNVGARNILIKNIKKENISRAVKLTTK
jgi:putative transposase